MYRFFKQPQVEITCFKNAIFAPAIVYFLKQYNFKWLCAYAAFHLGRTDNFLTAGCIKKATGVLQRHPLSITNAVIYLWMSPKCTEGRPRDRSPGTCARITEIISANAIFQLGLAIRYGAQRLDGQE